MKSLTEQIIELMPEERDGAKLEVGRTGDSQWRRDNYFFNLARTEMIKVIPEILSLIRDTYIKGYKSGNNLQRDWEILDEEERNYLLEKLK